MLINSKGQVTIPADLRESLGWHAGDEVDVVADDGAVRIVPREPTLGPGERLIRHMRGKGSANTDMTTDELMALLRDD
ncbi:MAG: AbrB/MazE/SpoVT family DNA-binding domain-containing protein [Stackebrandtia sp.]